MQVPGPSAPGESGAAAGSASGAHLTHPLPPGTSPLRPRLGRWSRDVAGGLSIRRAAPQACLGQSRHGAAVQKPGWVVAEPCRASRGAPACPPPPHTTAGLTRPGPEGQAAGGSPLCVQRGHGQRQGRGTASRSAQQGLPQGPPPGPPSGVCQPEAPPTPVVPAEQPGPRPPPDAGLTGRLRVRPPAGQPPAQRRTARHRPAWGHRGALFLQEAGPPPPSRTARPRGRPHLPTAAQAAFLSRDRAVPSLSSLSPPAPASTKRQQRRLGGAGRRQTRATADGERAQGDSGVGPRGLCPHAGHAAAVTWAGWDHAACVPPPPRTLHAA